MVGKILNVVYREVRGLHQAAYFLALFTFGSQLLALIRDRFLAHTYGAGIELDLYYTAFRIPDLMYVFFVSVLSVYVLIPFIARQTEEVSLQKARELLSQIFTLFLYGYSVLSLIVFWYTPEIVQQFFPGFTAQSEELVLLIRILLVQPFLLGISSLYGVVAQLEHRFILFAVSPLLYNVGIIFGIVCFVPFFGVTGLVGGVLLGAFLHVIVQLPFIIQSGLFPRLTRTFEWHIVREVVTSSATRAITLSLHQIVFLGLVGFASIMATGSVSVFQLGFNLQSVPLAIIGVSYSVVAFPLLARLFAEEKYDAFRSNIEVALRHIIFWSLPAMVLFIVIRAQFVRVVLGTGAFNWNDTRLTAAVLALFIISLASQAIHLLLVRALYAANNTKLPFYVTLASSSLAITLAFLFYVLFMQEGEFATWFERVMRLGGVSGIEVLALPLGYSCALILQSIVLTVLCGVKLGISVRSLIMPTVRSLIAALFGGYVAYSSLNYFVTAMTTDTLISVFLQGLLAGLSGVAGFILMHTVMRSEELIEMYRALRKKMTKQDMLVPQEEDTLAL
jgi:putative peptidoglycan lipid II flippase